MLNKMSKFLQNADERSYNLQQKLNIHNSFSRLVDTGKYLHLKNIKFLKQITTIFISVLNSTFLTSH